MSKKILLAAINAKYIHSNLAVYSLKSYAQSFCDTQKELDIEIAEYTINQQSDDILVDIYEREPKLLVFSCYIWNIAYVEELVREIAKICPRLPIWLGGPEVSYDAREVLERLPQVQGVMKGEGEKTFTELIQRKEYQEMQGITYRSGEGVIIENPWRPVMNLNEVPFVYDRIEAFEHKIIYYESSRGCPFSCSYCLSSIDKKLRFRNAQLVKEELQFFIDAGVPQVKFIDRTFNCNHEHAMNIWSYLKEHDNGITNFHFEISADLLNEEEIRVISAMRPGLIQLEIGVQSTNPDTIREIQRTMKFDQVAKVVKRIKETKNIHQHLDLIAGLPFENLKSFERSFNDVYALKPEQFQLGFLKVLKGSLMEEKKEEYGLVYKAAPPYEVLYTKWLSYDEVRRLKGVEKMVEEYYNSGQFGRTLDALEQHFVSAFSMYDRLSEHYGTTAPRTASQSRASKYEILLSFAVAVQSDQEAYYRELLTFDYYLRENAKNRPEFAGAYILDKEDVRNFYQKETLKTTYLPGYEQYNKNQIRRMTHLEQFEVLEKTVLFDYAYRCPLTKEARTVEV